MKKELIKEPNVKAWIGDCQLHNHVQQVAFSTYHHALTQICFTCDKVRTSIREDELQLVNQRSKTNE